VNYPLSERLLVIPGREHIFVSSLKIVPQPFVNLKYKFYFIHRSLVLYTFSSQWSFEVQMILLFCEKSDQTGQDCVNHLVFFPLKSEAYSLSGALSPIQEWTLHKWVSETNEYDCQILPCHRGDITRSFVYLLIPLAFIELFC
jgi:hypothetical protein